MSAELAPSEFMRKHMWLTDEEARELWQLIEVRFGPRPTDVEELRAWKQVRHSFVYENQTKAMLLRLRREVEYMMTRPKVGYERKFVEEWRRIDEANALHKQEGC